VRNCIWQPLLIQRHCSIVKGETRDKTSRTTRPGLIKTPIAHHEAPAKSHQPLLPLLAATKTEHQVERRLLLDVVVRKRAAILQLLASEDQALLVRWDALLVLDL